jgi:hypothetical protein
MLAAEEGKLLARAGGFNHPGGTDGGTRIDELCLRFSSLKMPALFAVTGIPFAPIRVREKRMNTYKTPKSRCGYQIRRK